jgi:hypothetical protein
MKLEHQFSWSNLETIYKRLDEERCKAIDEGKIEFTVESTEGVLYRGVGYMSSVSRMNEFDLWKLHPTTTKAGKPINIPMGVQMISEDAIKLQEKTSTMPDHPAFEKIKSKKVKG